MKNSLVISATVGNILLLIVLVLASCKDNAESSTLVKDINNVLVDTLTINNSADELEMSKLQRIQDKFYHIKLHKQEEDKDTIVYFDFFEKNKGLNYTFNYKPFIRRIYPDSISLYTKNIEVIIHKSKFDKFKAELNFDLDSLNLTEIDNHNVLGSKDIPNTYISKIVLNLSSKYVQIDKHYFEDLYEPNFDLTEAYYYDEEIIITMTNSKNDLSYTVTFFLDKELNIKRLVSKP